MGRAKRALILGRGAKECPKQMAHSSSYIVDSQVAYDDRRIHSRFGRREKRAPVMSGQCMDGWINGGSNPASTFVYSNPPVDYLLP